MLLSSTREKERENSQNVHHQLCSATMTRQEINLPFSSSPKFPGKWQFSVRCAYFLCPDTSNYNSFGAQNEGENSLIKGDYPEFSSTSLFLFPSSAPYLFKYTFLTPLCARYCSTAATGVGIKSTALEPVDCMKNFANFSAKRHPNILQIEVINKMWPHEVMMIWVVVLLVVKHII